jgi:TPR repeat protein
MRTVALGLALSCVFSFAADKSVEAGFLDALGLSRTRVIEKMLPESNGARCYREGMILRYSQPLNSEKAFELFLQGYEAGNASCASELSVCYLKGIGVRRSQSEALKVLSKGMVMTDGNPIDCELKWIGIHTGQNIELFDESKALAYVQRLLQLSTNNVTAASMLRHIYWSTGKPPVEAVTVEQHRKATLFLKESAMKGDPYACLEYGKILIGQGVVQDKRSPLYVDSDREEGLRLIKFAASKRVQGAEYVLYDYYSDVDQKPATAFEWLEKGWAGGDCRAGLSLSYALVKGIGTAVDKKRAVEIALKVGEQGDANQVYSVADYFTGYTGFDPSLSNFITWHRIAAERGNSDSADQLGKIYAGEEITGFKTKHPVSFEEAFKYFSIGAYPDGEHNFVYRLNSLLYLGDMYRRGLGCDANPGKAAELYLEYLTVFRKNDYLKDAYSDGGKVRMIWLKRHYPNLSGVSGIDSGRLKFNGFVDDIHSFKHFAREDFDYELFDEIAAVVKTGDRDEKNTFQRACSFVERNYGVKDGIFYFADLEHGKDFNSNSYEWYKEAALSGSPSAAFRLHDMLLRQGGKPNTIGAGPEYALRLSMGRTTSELVIAYAENEAWRQFGKALEDNFNFGRSKKRDFSKVAEGSPIYVQYGDEDVLPILRKINEAHRAQLAKDAAKSK